MQENSKVFNRIPLLALVHNRTRQNDGRISLQKQTSNDKRQSNLTKLVIGMSFVSVKVLLFDPKSFRRQECSLTLWSRNQHIAWFLCRKPSTMLSEIEALMLAMKLFFNTEVVFEELGWEAVSLFSRNTSVTCLEDLSLVNGWQAPRICSHHYTPLIAK